MVAAVADPQLKLVKAEARPEVRFKPDDDDLAIQLGAALSGRVSYFHAGWKLYEGGTWATRDAAEVRRYIRGELRTWRDRGVAVSQQRIRALASMLEDDLFVSDRVVMAQAEERKRYINLQNGLLDLETMRLEPHRPDLYFTTQLGFSYDSEADCPTFRRYLTSSLVHPGSDRVDYSLVELMMEALAYSMTARTDLKASFWLVGEKDSGKSTFISVIKGIMGDLHTTIDLTQLGSNRFLLGSIVGKRVVTFTEASGSSMLPDALYKALVGGTDEIYADVKNRDPIVFRPEAKVWWAMNEMPRISDRSGATTRRIVIIPFNRSIPEKERITNLEARLLAERPGILNWMLSHYGRLMKTNRFTHCNQSVARLEEYIAENDTEATYAQERLDLHESYRVSSQELYADYSEWCTQYGFRPKNFNQLAAEWRRLGLTVMKSDGLKYWRGARIKIKRPDV